MHLLSGRWCSRQTLKAFVCLTPKSHPCFTMGSARTSASTALQGSPPTAACPAHAGRHQPAKHVQSRPRGARRFDTKLPDTDVSKSLTRTGGRPSCRGKNHAEATMTKPHARGATRGEEGRISFSGSGAKTPEAPLRAQESGPISGSPLRMSDTNSYRTSMPSVTSR